MVKSETLYSPQDYLELITGECYIVRGDNDVEFINEILKQKNLELWDYPLSEIGHISENQLDVVLVDCMKCNEDNELVHEYRWFEVPANCKPNSYNDNSHFIDEHR